MSFALPDLAKRSLRHRGIGPEIDGVIEFVVGCLYEACALVSEDTGDERYDDRTSRGFLRWRRARNIMVERIAEEGPHAARAVDIENALRISTGDYALSFYSARDGIGRPDLSGTSKAKRNLVDEMQLQIEGVDGQTTTTRLALLYEADELGLERVAVGVLASAHEWSWQVGAFRREQLGKKPASRTSTPARRHPAYDEQPVSDLPQLRPRQKKDEDLGADES